MDKIGRGLLLIFVCNTNISAYAKDYTKVQIIEAELLKTQVKIIESNSDKVSVQILDKKFKESDCTYQEKMNDKKLFLSVEKKSNNADADCAISLLITAPKNVELKFIADSGSIITNGHFTQSSIFVNEGIISVDGNLENLDVSVASGFINLNGRFKNLNVAFVNGQLKFNGSSQIAKYNVGNGKIFLSYNEPVIKGEVAIRALNIEAEIYIPAGMNIKTSFITASGVVKNNVGELSSSEFGVYFKAISGNLNIEKNI